MNEITQEELQTYFDLVAEVAKGMRIISEMRESITTALKDGVPIEEGQRFAYIKTNPGRRSVAWKKVVVRLAGEAYAKRVLAATKPGPDREELVVE
jgi:hypothetical protein